MKKDNNFPLPGCEINPSLIIKLDIVKKFFSNHLTLNKKK
jgi:hypothetical protein